MLINKPLINRIFNPVKIKIYAFYIILLFSMIHNHTALAIIYPLPKGENRIVGKNLYITIPEGNTLPLEHFAAQFQIGLSNMQEANSNLDVYLPAAGTQLIIPQQLILPDTPHEGIVINNAEMRLYFYPKDSGTVVVLPIAIGELGRETPSNWITSIKRKKHQPTWTPTKSMHTEYMARGEIIPNIFPPGPDNPMGLHALYIGRLYAIHGTNANFGIGLRVSHGCVRLRTNDIKYLFNHVPIGTRVQFINEPVKATLETDGRRYLEVHNPLSTTEEQFNSNELIPINLPISIRHLIADPHVNQDTVEKALQRRSGMPLNINT